MAAAWDPELARTFGQIAAEEISSRGEHLLEAPGLNIARVPQNGRNFEYFGEDPFLTARMSIAQVRGIQAAGIIAEPKHYAANNQEHDRKTINEVIDERTLREIYLSAFEATVKEAHPGAIMCAYPSVNGQFSCENVHVLKDILRGDWGFQGFVQSDYTATRNAVANATAGLDLAMKPDHYDAEKIAPLFPFGFGLSYTSFQLDRLTVSGPTAGKVIVELDVTNTGQRDGADVAQAYVGYPSDAGEPPKQLRGFAKVKLRAHETRHVLMTLDDQAFSIWDTSLNKWSLVPGKYEILVGDSSDHLPLRATVTVPCQR